VFHQQAAQTLQGCEGHDSWARVHTSSSFRRTTLSSTPSSRWRGDPPKRLELLSPCQMNGVDSGACCHAKVVSSVARLYIHG
jgi:hypothetical protein